MKTFDVYPRFDINITRGEGCHVWDAQGQRYLDFYGGHAVISIGHSHPHYQARIRNQLAALGFYSNSVLMPIQEEFAGLLGQMSGYPDYHLFLCNSGAEANENALKLASFHNGRKGLVAFDGAFHGRTSLAVAVTDNAKYRAPVNDGPWVDFVPRYDLPSVQNILRDGRTAAVILEGIQGVGGIHMPDAGFLRQLRSLCDETDTVLILDEVQSGYG
ncbi:MAG: aspartate aminotransferase family protein, partial [Calditrichaeota bacterium]|nr:aspartate aminotransferase family protein [Calditrichota bacterium]